MSDYGVMEAMKVGFVKKLDGARNEIETLQAQHRQELRDVRVPFRANRTPAIAKDDVKKMLRSGLMMGEESWTNCRG